MSFNRNDFYHKLKFITAINAHLDEYDKATRTTYLEIIDELKKLIPHPTDEMKNIFLNHEIYVENIETRKNRHILSGLDTIEISSSYLFPVIYSEQGKILQTIEMESKINLKKIHTLRLLLQPGLDIAVVIGGIFSSIIASSNAFIKNLDNPQKEVKLSLEEDFIYDDVQVCDKLLFKLNENSLIFIPKQTDIEVGDYVEVRFGELANLD